MNWIRYSIGNTRANNSMPQSIGAPLVHASGQGGAPPADDLIAQARATFRFVFSRVFGRVN